MVTDLSPKGVHLLGEQLQGALIANFALRVKYFAGIAYHHLGGLQNAGVKRGHAMPQGILRPHTAGNAG